MRKAIGSNTTTGKLLDNKSLIDRVIRHGGDASKYNGGYILKLKPDYSTQGLQFAIRNFSTDHIIFSEIVLKGGGDYSLLPRLAKELGIDIRYIVDAGANIGSATVYMKSVFPEAHIICIEPEPGNLAVLSRNIELNNFEDVQLKHNALWSNNDELNIGVGMRGKREKELSFGVVESEDGTIKVKGMTFKDCLEVLKTDIIDVFKIDIEGAEVELLKDKEELKYIIDHTNILAIELHHEVVDILDFHKLMETYNMKHIQQGEITYCWKAK